MTAHSRSATASNRQVDHCAPAHPEYGLRLRSAQAQRVGRSSPWTSFGYRCMPRFGQGVAMRLAILAIAANLSLQVYAQTKTQRVELAPGWNLVSLHVLPSDRSMSAVLGDEVSAVRVIKNADNHRYEPAAGIDELSPWQPDQAYYVWAKQATTVTVTGQPIDPSTPITLDAGWNLVPYLQSRSMPIGEAFANVLSDLHLIKDASGNVYAPEHGVDRIGQMVPGRGYEVRMRHPAVLGYASPSASSFVYDAGCVSHPGAVLLENYGALTTGVSADSLQRVANAAAINAALDDAPVGGAVCLPADSLYLAWDQAPTKWHGHIRIPRDKITLWGAGACGWGELAGCTYIATPGDELYAIEDQGNELLVLMRGHGIKVTAPRPKPGETLRDITIRGLELDGQLGWTGCYSYSYKRNYWVNRDCWDLSHKGIVIGADKDITDVLVEDVKVHGYRGEIMYLGGSGFGRVTARRVWAYGSNGSANNFATAKDLLIEDSRFGYPASSDPGNRVRFWHEFLAEHTDNLKATIRNNEYAGCEIGSGCIAMAFDDVKNAANGQQWKFEGNSFECRSIDGGDRTAFLFEAGRYSISIKGNKFEDCRLAYFNGGSGKETTRIEVADNEILVGSGNMISFQGGRYRGSIHQNILNGMSEARPFMVSGGVLHDLAIENNVLSSFKSPIFEGGGPDSAPLVTANTYKDFIHRVYRPSREGFIQPTYDVHHLRATASGRVLELDGRYADEQQVRIEVDPRSKNMTLPVGRPHHGWESPIVLRPGDTLTLTFDRDTKKWHLDEDADVALGG